MFSLWVVHKFCVGSETFFLCIYFGLLFHMGPPLEVLNFENLNYIVIYTDKLLMSSDISLGTPHKIDSPQIEGHGMVWVFSGLNI